MYQILKNGSAIGMTEQPNYIRKHAGGFYLLCPEPEAQGVAVDGTPYNLYGRVEMEGLETVMLIDTDGGGVIYDSNQILNALLGTEVAE